MSVAAAVGPLVAGLVLGQVLRRAGVGTAEHGRFLLVLNFNVCLPALVFPAVAEARLAPSLLVFPLAAAIMVAVGFLAGSVLARRLSSDPADRALVTTSLMVVNCAFAIPFVGAVYGPAGVLRVAAFDLVHSLLVATAVLGVAVSANPRRPATAGAVPMALLRTPVLYALVIGIGINLLGWPLPAAVGETLQPFASASLAIVALGSGLVAERVQRRGEVVAVALVRLVVGLLTALLVSIAFGLEGIDRGVLLMLGVTPLGFVVVTFAGAHHLGTRFATSLLVVTLVISISAYVPLALVS